MWVMGYLVRVCWGGMGRACGRRGAGSGDPIAGDDVSHAMSKVKGAF